jgi:hypothetical protein
MLQNKFQDIIIKWYFLKPKSIITGLLPYGEYVCGYLNLENLNGHP